MAVQEVPNPMIHKIELNPKSESNKAKTKVEEILAERENMAAQRYSAATLESMAVEAENATAKLKGEPPVHRIRDEEDEEDERREQRREKKRERVMAAARALIDSGADPEIVARMMLQIPGENHVPPQSDKTSILELTEALEHMNNIALSREPKTDTHMAEVLADLRAEQKELRNLILKLATDGIGEKSTKVDPITTVANQAKAMKDYLSSVKSLAEEWGWQPPNGMKKIEGKTIDEIKEMNRHDEEMAKFNIDKEYKMAMADTLGQLPEMVGAGIGKFMQGSGEESISKPPVAQSEPGGIESHLCTCGTKIYAPPSATSVKCPNPKCNKVYELTREPTPVPEVAR